jgi:S1-C subfamily serine protease
MECDRRQLKEQKLFKTVLWSFLNSYGWRLKLLPVILVLLYGSCWQQKLVRTQTVPSYVLPDDSYSQDIYHLAQSTTVRIVQINSSGSGVIINQQGQIYTVLTNWHVVATDNVLTILTADGQAYPLLQPPQQLNNLDLAVIQFQSPNNYQVATLANEIPQVGEKVYAAGFPLYNPRRSTDTISLGIQAFRLTQGEISLIPPKSLPEGYHLGYTNNIEIGMSGGPIFSTQGFLIGINGRGKYRDPDFGVYTFEDGSEPTPEMLETMVNSSWGIPITAYLQFASQVSQFPSVER